MKWEDGKIQSESMDLVREIDERYGSTDSGSGSDIGMSLYPEDIQNEVIDKAERAFRNIFPKKARPSSRAAFLFRYDGNPLWKNEFEAVLKDTDELLGETSETSENNNGGPFFCGDRFTAADIAWAPFLERYAGQLPCLHDGLNPRCKDTYPNLHNWYTAMETIIPAYACRVRGDLSSWRKVLTMAGFGNAGALPSLVSSRMEELAIKEGEPLSLQERQNQQSLWDQYSATRPYVASSPNEEAASVLIRNRENIVKDISKNNKNYDLPSDTNELDETMRSLACLLCNEDRYSDEIVQTCKDKHGKHVRSLAAFLDDRMCVPRDMGVLSAAYFKRF